MIQPELVLWERTRGTVPVSWPCVLALCLCHAERFNCVKNTLRALFRTSQERFWKAAAGKQRQSPAGKVIEVMRLPAGFPVSMLYMLSMLYLPVLFELSSNIPWDRSGTRSDQTDRQSHSPQAHAGETEYGSRLSHRCAQPLPALPRGIQYRVRR